MSRDPERDELLADDLSCDFLEDDDDSDAYHHPRATRFRTDKLAFDRFTLTLAGFHRLGRRFLLWRSVAPRTPGKKRVKMPVNSWGRAIDHTDEHEWLTFREATTYAARCGLGLGVALGWGFGGLDLDHCVDPEWGQPSADAQAILRHFPTYTEYSPSGRGVHSYFFTGPSFTTTAKRDDKGIELYAGRRWFALTGICGLPPHDCRHLEPLADCTANAIKLATVLRPPSPPRAPRPPAPPATDALARLEDCKPIRQRPSIFGGTIYSLRRCPFTNDEHRGGGPFAVVFEDGGVLFRCDRSIHGPLREMVQPSRGRR
jgi:hypothetical protein